MTETRPRRLPLWVGAAAIIGILQLLVVFNPAMVEVDPEEMINASHAWTIAQEGLGLAWPLQYRPFCGGCTADALLGAALFSWLPPSWVIWKLVPVGFTVLLAWAGMRTLHRRVGPAAAVAFGLLLVFPPRAWLQLSLIAWGNHYESGVLVLCAALLASRRSTGAAAGAGMVLGLAIWVGFSALFGVPALILWLALARRWRSLGALILGLQVVWIPWGLQWGLAGTTPFSGIYQTGEAVPSLARIPAKLGNLFHPRQLMALFGIREHALGKTLGLAYAGVAAGGLCWAAWRDLPLARLVALLVGAWVAVYAVVRFEMGLPPAPEVAVAGTVRYAAPLYPALFLGLSVVLGHLWQRRRWAVLAAVAFIPLTAGMGARGLAMAGPFPVSEVARLAALDHEAFRPQASWQLHGSGQLDGATAGDDRWSRSLQGYARGWRDATALLRADENAVSLDDRWANEPGWWQGIGAAMAEQLDDRGQGGVDYLVEGHRFLLAETADHTEGHRLALRQAAWARRDAPGALQRSVDAHDDAVFTDVTEILEGVPAPVADAAWWALGRRWAHDVAPWLVVQDPALPERLPSASASFSEGLGHGFGEHWGPREPVPTPRGLPPGWLVSYELGFSEGIRFRWLGGEGASRQ